LTELVRDKKQYDKNTRPVCAFITFESDDGYNEALLYSRKVSWLEAGYKKPEEGGPCTDKVLGADL
jgi:hypothetical protein